MFDRNSTTTRLNQPIYICLMEIHHNKVESTNIYMCVFNGDSPQQG